MRLLKILISILLTMFLIISCSSDSDGSNDSIKVTRLVFSSSPPSEGRINTDLSGNVVVDAVNDSGEIGTKYSNEITLKAYSDISCTVIASGTLSSSYGITQAASKGRVIWEDLKYSEVGTIYLKAESSDGFFSESSDAIVISEGSHSGILEEGSFAEPESADSNADTMEEAVNVFDFTLSEQSADEDSNPLIITEIRINVSGTGDPSSSSVTWILNGPDATDVTGTCSGGVITFSGLNINISDDDSIGETYAVSVFFNPSSTLTDGQTYILSCNGDTDITMDPYGSLSSGSNSTISTTFEFDVIATSFAITTPSSAVMDTFFTVSVNAVDDNGKTDTDNNSSITLSAFSDDSCSTAVAGIFSSSTVLTKDTSGGSVTWNDLRYNLEQQIYIHATGGSLTEACSDNYIMVGGQSASGQLVAGSLSEPAYVSSLADTLEEAVPVFDFILKENSSDNDADPLLVNEIRINVSGTASAASANAAWLLNGPDVTNATGSYSGGVLTFTGLDISVADNNTTGETYTVSVYFAPEATSTVTDQQTYIFSIDGDTNLSLGTGGSLMTGANAGVTNGTGFYYNVVATQIVFTTQPPELGVIDTDLTGSIQITAEGSSGKIDYGCNSSVTLSPYMNTACTTGSYGALSSTDTGGITKTFSTGVASWTDLKISSFGPLYIKAVSGSISGVSNGVTVAALGGAGSPYASYAEDICYSYESGTYFIYIAGMADNDWRIEKRNCDTGQLVTGFGSSGSVSVDLSGGSTTQNSIFGITCDSTYIYVAGEQHKTSGTDDSQWRIEKRYKSSGALVTTFGTSGVITYDNGGDNVTERPFDIVCYESNEYMVISGVDINGGRIEFRNISTGALNTYFGTSGVISATTYRPLSIYTNYDGDLFVGGYDGSSTWRIEKRDLNSNAGLDTSFSTDGIVTASSTPGYGASQMILASELVGGTIVPYVYIAGYNEVSGYDNWKVIKYSANDGSLSSGFGSSGVLNTNPSSWDDWLNSITYSYPYIYLAGTYSTSSTSYQYWRIEKRDAATGTLVTGFGNGGIVSSTSLYNAYPNIVQVGNDDYLYIVGYDNDRNWRIEKRDLTTGI